MKLVVKKKVNINVCLKSREVLVKVEINALTYREDRGIEHTGLERVWECEKVVFNYEVEKPNWNIYFFDGNLIDIW